MVRKDGGLKDLAKSALGCYSFENETEISRSEYEFRRCLNKSFLLVRNMTKSRKTINDMICLLGTCDKQYWEYMSIVTMSG